MQNLELYVSKSNDIIGKSEIKLEWERKLSHSYPFDNFFALIVNSIENGVQAIDISLNKDVFYSNANSQDTIHLISHEFGIYILKDVLKDTNAFMNFSNYEILEALAEFFNPVENPNSHFLKNESHYFKFFKQLINENHTISIKELFIIASKKFKIIRNDIEFLKNNNSKQMHHSLKITVDILNMNF